jgi:hypothetical protein
MKKISILLAILLLPAAFGSCSEDEAIAVRKVEFRMNGTPYSMECGVTEVHAGIPLGYANGGYLSLAALATQISTNILVDGYPPPEYASIFLMAPDTAGTPQDGGGQIAVGGNSYSFSGTITFSTIPAAGSDIIGSFSGTATRVTTTNTISDGIFRVVMLTPEEAALLK